MTFFISILLISLSYMFYITFNGNVLSNIALCDAAEPYQLGPQDPATVSAEWLLNLHDEIMVDLIIIVVMVMFLLYTIFSQFSETKNTLPEKKLSHAFDLEIVWTIIPALILLAIAQPTFSLLYAIDDFAEGKMIIKITGHQWYWSYEQVEPLWSHAESPIAFDSYMISNDDLQFGRLRLLEVDNRLYVPTKTHLTLLITSADVLHSWTIPSFGVKVDACPGRLSKASIYIKRAGLYFGQCSEICGVNHGFMPIVVKAYNV